MQPSLHWERKSETLAGHVRLFLQDGNAEDLVPATSHGQPQHLWPGVLWLHWGPGIPHPGRNSQPQERFPAESIFACLWTN